MKNKFTSLILIIVLLAFSLMAFSPMQSAADFQVTPESIAAVAGVVLSMAFAYIPGLRPRFEALEPDYKRLVMLGMLLLVSAAIFGLSCAGIYNHITCDAAGAWTMVEIFMYAAVANQTAFLLLPGKPKKDQLKYPV